MRLRSVSASLLMLPLLLAAGCAPPTIEAQEKQASTNQAIIGGTTSASRDAVVLINNGGRPWCSATLITPNLVLTARHCVSDFNDNTECGRSTNDLPASIFTVSTGTYPDSSQIAARGTQMYLPNTQDVFCGNDIALILLDKDIPNAKPAKVRFSTTIASEIDTAVGYGDTGQNAPPQRRERDDVHTLTYGPSNNASYTTSNGNVISQITLDQNEIMVTESICDGDSGGPLLDSVGQVLAVASEGLASCFDRPSFFTALGPFEQLIKNAATASGHPLDQMGSSNPTNPTENATVKAPTQQAQSGDPTGSGDQGDSDPTKPKKKAATLPSAGCSATPSSLSSSQTWLAGLVLSASLLLRRRRARAQVSQ